MSDKAITERQQHWLDHLKAAEARGYCQLKTECLIILGKRCVKGIWWGEAWNRDSAKAVLLFRLPITRQIQI